jgi:hypothetical protein
VADSSEQSRAGATLHPRPPGGPTTCHFGNYGVQLRVIWETIVSGTSLLPLRLLSNMGSSFQWSVPLEAPFRALGASSTTCPDARRVVSGSDGIRRSVCSTIGADELSGQFRDAGNPGRVGARSACLQPSANRREPWSDAAPVRTGSRTRGDRERRRASQMPGDRRLLLSGCGGCRFRSGRCRSVGRGEPW